MIRKKFITLTIFFTILWNEKYGNIYGQRYCLLMAWFLFDVWYNIWLMEPFKR